MDKKSFCPFVKGECNKDCMFFTSSSADYSDNTYRTCLIAKGLNNIPIYGEELLEDICKTLKSQG